MAFSDNIRRRLKQRIVQELFRANRFLWHIL